MSKRVRIILVVLLLVIGIPILALLVLPARPDATTHAKVAEVFMYLGAAQRELSDRCNQKSLVAGITHKSLGFLDPYKPGHFVQDVKVRVEGPKRLLITATLTDIHLDILPFWKRLTIPAGATLVLQGSCENGLVKWELHDTTIPSQYLPISHRRSGTGKGFR